jgi:hypothetical protein
MKRYISIGSGLKLILLVVGCLANLSAPLYAADNDPRAKEILDRIDDLFRGQSAQGKMTMKVNTAHWSREMSLEFWDKGKEKSLIRILAPAKEKGTATLKSGQDIWNYLPKVKRVIKLPSSMMGGSWMGSHFTNDDLVKESRMAEDYNFVISFEGSRDGQEIIEINCTPKLDAAVVWGKVVVSFNKQNNLPSQLLYYGEDQKLARTMTFSDIKKMGDRTLPSVAKMVPADKPNEFTELVYQEVRFDVPLADDMFTLRNLER